MWIEIPCKVGDEFYALLHTPFKSDGALDVFHVWVDGIFLSFERDYGISQTVYVVCVDYNDMQWKIDFDDVRDFCFQTKEEAENKLKEMQNNESRITT